MNYRVEFLSAPEADGTAGDAGMEPTDVHAHVYTVGRLNRMARSILEVELGNVLVSGEISNFSRPASGHMYFTLKDDKAQLRCAMFRGKNSRLNFAPEVGMGVIAGGRISLYEARGDYQLIVETLKPAGAGDLHLAFEKLKQKLHKEGLFDAELKRPLPQYPRCLGVLTSATGAALHDVLSVLGRRWPLMPVILYPVPVQGDASAPAICSMLATTNRRAECDVLLLARGGGSLEDLWPFNEETVARALRASKIPTVTGIGHEVDITIADLAADQRGATPSAAAELLSPNRDHALALVQDAEDRLLRLFTARLKELHLAVERLAGKLQSPVARVTGMRQRADELSMRMVRAVQVSAQRHHLRLQGLQARLAHAHPGPRVNAAQIHSTQQLQRLQQAWGRVYMRMQERVRGAGAELDAVSPQAVLRRGYAILERTHDGRVVTDAGSLAEGERLRARLHQGEAELRVEHTQVHKPCAADRT